MIDPNLSDGFSMRGLDVPRGVAIAAIVAMLVLYAGFAHWMGWL